LFFLKLHLTIESLKNKKNKRHEKETTVSHSGEVIIKKVGFFGPVL
jgi:hypothetical protein